MFNRLVFNTLQHSLCLVWKCTVFVIFCRSGSLGSAGVQIASNQSSPASEYAMGETGIENLDDAQKLIRDLRQKTRAQAQQLLAWRRAYKMQVI